MSNFEEEITELIQKNNIPGLSMSIVKDEEITYTRSFGAKDYYKQEPCDENTLFGIGSVSKSFTCLAILQLQEQGKLDISDPVSKYIPLRLQKDKPITIKHLMTHSSGIPDLSVLSIQINILCCRDDTTPIIPLSSINDLMLHVNSSTDEGIDPGKRFFYFNSGFTMLGFIVEKVTGISFEAYVKENILKPLSMDRSTYDGNQFYSDSNHSKGYMIEKEGERYIPRERKPVFHRFFSAPGGMLTSVTELSNYLIMNMNGGKFGEKQLINPELLELGHSHQYSGESLGIQTPTLGSRSYGYGWSVYENVFGHRLVAHSGSVGTYSAYLAFFPDLKIGISIMLNHKDLPLEIILKSLTHALGIETDLPELKYLKYLNSLTGMYEAFKGVTDMKIEKMAGTLIMHLTRSKMSYALIPEDMSKILPTKFYAITAFKGKIPVEFIIKDNNISVFFERNHFHKI